MTAPAFEFIRRFPACMLLGLFGLPVFVILMPDVEENRTEARRSHAVDTVIELERFLSGQAPDASGDLDALDPWGTPYRITFLDAERIRVSSAGQDRTWSPDSQSDDIHSDRPVSPYDLAHARQKTVRWLIACIAAGCTWLAACIAYDRLTRRNRSASDGEATTPSP